MEFTEYIRENAMILIPVLYVIGMILKNTPKTPDWIIPWALTGVGVVIGVLIFGFNADGVIQGILAAGVAVLGNQILKQTIHKD